MFPHEMRSFISQIVFENKKAFAYDECEENKYFSEFRVCGSGATRSGIVRTTNDPKEEEEEEEEDHHPTAFQVSLRLSE